LDTNIYYCARASNGPGPPNCRGFTMTFIHAALSRTPLDEWSVKSRDIYLTARNTYKIQTSCPQRDLNPALPASESQQTHGLDRAATWIGIPTFSEKLTWRGFHSSWIYNTLSHNWFPTFRDLEVVSPCTVETSDSREWITRQTLIYVMRISRWGFGRFWGYGVVILDEYRTQHRN
jgi:hypothetical protein